MNASHKQSTPAHISRTVPGRHINSVFTAPFNSEYPIFETQPGMIRKFGIEVGLPHNIRLGGQHSVYDNGIGSLYALIGKENDGYRTQLMLTGTHISDTPGLYTSGRIGCEYLTFPQECIANAGGAVTYSTLEGKESSEALYSSSPNTRMTYRKPPYRGVSLHSDIVGYMPINGSTSPHTQIGIDAHGYTPITQDSQLILHGHGYMGSIITLDRSYLNPAYTFNIHQTPLIRGNSLSSAIDSTDKSHKQVALANLECIYPLNETRTWNLYGFYDTGISWNPHDCITQAEHHNDYDSQMHEAPYYKTQQVVGVGINVGHFNVTCGYTLGYKNTRPITIDISFGMAF